jgi:hypothetical protein
VVMGSATIDVCIGSFLFAPKSPHINGSVSNADEVHPPGHVFPLARMASASPCISTKKGDSEKN